MIKHINLLSFIVCSTLLMACSDNNADREHKADTVFQGQLDALDKARSVEDTLLESSRQQREAIDTQSR